MSDSAAYVEQLEIALRAARPYVEWMMSEGYSEQERQVAENDLALIDAALGEEPK